MRFALYFATLLMITELCEAQQGNCVDKYSREVCQAYSRTNQCVHVRNSCASTCGACQAGGSTSTNGMSSVATQPRPQPRPQPSVSVPNCIDNDVNSCPSWASQGYCNTNAYVQNNCRKSCGFCNAGTPSCSDDVAWCPSWEAQGHCNTNQYVQRNCRKSCRFCNTANNVRVNRVAIWSSWGNMGSCSVTCGQGKQTKYRTCSGTGCVGSSSDTTDCYLDPCQRPSWSQWENFGSCSVTCGNGVITKVRYCQGVQCVGSETRQGNCDLGNCPTSSTSGSASACTELVVCSTLLAFGSLSCDNFAVGIACPKSCNKCESPDTSVTSRGITGTYGEWTKFGSCSKSCGEGEKTRRRECNGGMVCNGPSTDTESCFEKECQDPPSWGPWSTYSDCSVSCGGGTQKRTRDCQRGTSCKGRSSTERNCNNSPCPSVPSIQQDPPAWGKWSTYSSCSVTCGTGKQTRTRNCLRGSSCEGDSSSDRTCNKQLCPRPEKWSQCTRTCGGGTRYKFDSFSCLNPRNYACDRTFEICNSMSCPKATCSPGVNKLRFQSETECCRLRQTRIIGGSQAKLSNFPWTVLILTTLSEDGPMLCTGAILSKRWVLTAGHCINPSRSRTNMELYAGVVNLSSRGSDNRLNLKNAFRHPSYDDNSLENDIGLIELDSDIPTAVGSVEPVELPQGEETPIDSRCFVAGWGLTDASDIKSISYPLLFTGLDILDPAICRKRYNEDASADRPKKEYVRRSDKYICAGSLTKNTDTCRGDSGAALVCQRCRWCRWYITGVTSFGPKGRCGLPGYPAVYTKVKEYESWINSRTRISSSAREYCP